MRIIAGEFRSRVLKSFEGRGIRPMLDRVRQVLFDRLRESASEARDVLDLYAGTGSLGLEALSRGARRATFVERAPASLGVLRENLAALSLPEDRYRILPGAALSVAARLAAAPERFDLVFLDPPYPETRPGPAAEAFRAALATDVLFRLTSPGAALVLHVEAGSDVPSAGGFSAFDVRTVGESAVALAFRGDDPVPDVAGG
jgi:16S rRNA (guanine966-N2)-methyltransferase